MLHIPRVDYSLKTEVKFVFGRNNIGEDLLNFLDDVNLVELKEQNRLLMTLVDHNVVAGCLDCVRDSVVQVIDHHKLEASFCSSVDKTIEMVGSCATLVGEKILQQRRELLDETIAKLLISTILIDTANFSKTAKKATPKDVCVFEELSTYLHNLDIDWNAEYSKIQAAKRSTSGLTVNDLLRKDLKTVNVNGLTIAIPTVPITMEQLAAMPNFTNEMEQFRQQQQAEAVIVMTLITNDGASGSPHRGMVIYTDRHPLRDNLIEYLKTLEDVPLKLRECTVHFVSATSAEVRFFVQKNIAASRKIVLPAVRQFAQLFTSQT